MLLHRNFLLIIYTAEYETDLELPHSYFISFLLKRFINEVVTEWFSPLVFVQVLFWRDKEKALISNNTDTGKQATDLWF